ncbi:MAG TPA: SUF system NifU family Fe-S cluster assembly protein [Candidatus Peribacteraceae bacterium]|nr:SUF system NifU family Fe-S cluster assembly protein [Candidatus Peribacteraceae bacterium]
MDLYADIILDHYRAPRHKGELANVSVTHTEKNLSCGDEVTLQLKIADDGVAELAWTGEGCAISQAGMSMLAEEIAGKSLAEIDALTPADIRTMLGVPVGHRRVKCALLSLHTLQNALNELRNEPLQSWAETVGNDEESR